MTKIRGNFVAHFALVAFMAQLLPFASFAAEVEAEKAFDPTLPPAFDMSKVSNQGQVFTSCSSALQASVDSTIKQLGNLAKTGKAAPTTVIGLGMNAVCVGSEATPGVDSLSCTTLKVGAKELEAQIDAALGNISCQKNKLQAVQGELKCLSTQADMLAQQVTSIQGAYQSNISRMQQDVDTLDGTIADYTSQKEDALKKLNGDPDSGNGSQGLLSIREKIKSTVSAEIPEGLKALSQRVSLIKRDQNSITNYIESRKMGLAAQCLQSQPVQGTRCVPNGPLVTALEGVACRYEQNQSLNSNHQLSQSSIKQSQAKASADALRSMLAQMMSDMPHSGGSDGEGAASAATLRTMDEFNKTYLPQLQKFDVQGLSISSFIKNQLTSCLQESTKTVNTELQDARSQVRTMQDGYNASMDQLKIDLNTEIQKNSLAWSEAMTALTGMNMPLNTANCSAAEPSVRIKCLNDIKVNMEGLLQGNVKQSSIAMKIQGNKTSTNLQCQGINGCIAALQNFDRNIQPQIQKAKSFKQSYVMKARQSTQEFTKQMAKIMSAQSTALNSHLKALNAALGTLGVPKGIKIDPVKAEKLSYADSDKEGDQAGLPNVPSDVLALVGGQMTPPMLDVSAANFSDATSVISDRMSKLGEKEGKAQAAVDKLASLKVSCAKESADKAVAALLSDSAVLSTGNCQYVANFCEKNGNLSGLAGTLRDLARADGVGTSDDLSSAVSNLETGANLCGNSSYELQNDQLESLTAKRDLLMDKLNGARKGERQVTEFNAKIDKIDSKIEVYEDKSGALTPEEQQKLDSLKRNREILVAERDRLSGQDESVEGLQAQLSQTNSSIDGIKSTLKSGNSASCLALSSKLNKDLKDLRSATGASEAKASSAD